MVYGLLMTAAVTAKMVLAAARHLSAAQMARAATNQVVGGVWNDAGKKEQAAALVAAGADAGALFALRACPNHKGERGLCAEDAAQALAVVAARSASLTAAETAFRAKPRADARNIEIAARCALRDAIEVALAVPGIDRKPLLARFFAEGGVR